MNTTDLATIRVHPATASIPQRDPQWYELLRRSLRQRGQDRAIYLLDGMLFDGRARLRICRELRLEPRIVELSAEEVGEPVSFLKAMRLMEAAANKRALAAARPAPQAAIGQPDLRQVLDRLMALTPEVGLFLWDGDPRWIRIVADVALVAGVIGP